MSETPNEDLLMNTPTLALVRDENTRLQAALAAATQRAEAAERELALVHRDAERWRNHLELQGLGRLPGALYVRLTVCEEANDTGKSWHHEQVILREQYSLSPRIVALVVERQATELLAAIDAATKGEEGK